MTLFNSILVLSNPYAGKGRAGRITSTVVKRLRAKNIQFEHHSAVWPASLTNYTAVFLVGGDGTLNYFINKYRQVVIPIAIFKGGSGNDFAWKLYRNLSPQDYFDRIFFENVRQIDAASCNERLFINGFGIGFDGAIVESMAGKKKLSAGHLAYLYSVIKNVLFFPESRIWFQVDQEDRRVETSFLIAVANGERYGGGFRIAPESRLDDGRLDLILIKRIPPMRRIFQIPLVQKGRPLSLDFVEHRHMQRIFIEPSAKVPAHCDGELMFAATFDIRLLPGQYRFFC